ncbi:AraC family transcriptional regulator [Paenibacillus eucommiae]|uniref:AraC-like DNA-binding protein/ABC-type Fe3+-hydroxamate transport system substrate-binding protein n=1 Tax=Paenibacillus eucommiae TaxID=1355755 RepID=A0ABS4ITX0_9BACL|nr:AraC family transcriptional regulator [Paenibacillus eucommiae]MBP1990993.1 AraC-like DNA-binding protein/ABC-type Fe3+-hydroxamate transport system substrate-binding protein [Paenibacillus eucommiae]
MKELTARPTKSRPMLYVLADIQYATQLHECSTNNKAAGAYSLLAVTGGKGRIAVGETDSVLERGKCFIVPPGLTCVIYPGMQGLSFYHLSFEQLMPGKSDTSAAVSSILENSLFPCQGEVTCTPFSRYIDLIEAIYSHYDNPDPIMALQNHIRFEELIVLILQQNLIPESEGDVRRAVERSIAYVREHYPEKLTVEQLAGLVEVGRWKYTKAFKEMTGQIPLDYVNGVRVERSKQLLLMTDDRLFDISQRVGFNSEYYFNRRFKQAVGISPGQYRRNHRENPRIFAPFLEDYMVALGITPVVQFSHALWGKQDYLGMEEVPVFDVTVGDWSALAVHKPEFILLADGFQRWSLGRCDELAPTFKMPSLTQDWRLKLRKAADLLGKTEAAEVVISRYERKADEAKKILKKAAKGQTVACLRISASSVTLYGGPERGYTGPVLYKDLALEPHPLVMQLAAGVNRVALSPESLSRLDADHLFITFDKEEGEGRELLDTPLWKGLRAVRNQCVYEVDFLSWMNYGILSHSKKIDDVLLVMG